MNLLSTLVALPVLILSAHAQEIGVTTCSCQPATYEFKLNFNLICSDRDIRPGDPGIIDTACVLNPQGEEIVEDLVPVRVTEVQILELDQNLQVVSHTTLKDNFLDGAVFNYSSITQTMPSKLNVTSLPKGIQVFLTGRNAQEQDLVNFWAIVFDNDCGVFPLLEEGQKMGWTAFTDLGAPAQFLCAAAPEEPSSSSPSAAAVTEEPSPIAPTTACPPLNIKGSLSGYSNNDGRPSSKKSGSSSSSKGRERKRGLMVGHTGSPAVTPTACPEPDSIGASQSVPIKKKKKSSKKAKEGMSKISKGKNSQSQRRFLMERVR